jgi:hypothetical protein
MEMKPFNFEAYLLENDWEIINGIFFKNKKSIRLIRSKKERLMIALNLNPKVKHKHIITCRIPTSFDFANELFHKTFLT